MGDSSGGTAPLSHFLWTLSFSLSLVLVSAFLHSFLFFKATFISVCASLTPPGSVLSAQGPLFLSYHLGIPPWVAWSVPSWVAVRGGKGLSPCLFPSSGKAREALPAPRGRSYEPSTLSA